MESNSVILWFLVQFDQDRDPLGIGQSQNLKIFPSAAPFSAPAAAKGGFAYLNLLRFNETIIIGHDPEIVLIDRDPPGVLESRIDYIDHHPAPTLRLDNLSPVNIYTLMLPS